MTVRKHEEILVVQPGRGRQYKFGNLQAMFKCDELETSANYSLSEWVLEPHSKGLGVHQHASTDEVFYILEGTLTVLAGDAWLDVVPGTTLRIPAGTQHSFINQTNAPVRVLCFCVPGGFERNIPAMVDHFNSQKENA